MKKEVKIVVQNEQVRLDRYLKRIYPNLTQGIIESSLRKSLVKLNSCKVKGNIRVVSGDVITIKSNTFFDDSNQEESKRASRNAISLSNKILSEYLLYSSNEFIVINKPHNLVVQGGRGISLSIDDALSYLNQKQDINYKLVHRLDKETSGILLIAKGAENATKLGLAFKDKIIKKKYTALLSGCPKQSSGKLVHYIGKDRSLNFEIVVATKDGKLAETEYKILKKSKNFALVEFTPLTGRTHQLRFHSKFLGVPIVGDSKYGGKKYSRMLLHATKITIPHSVFGKEIVIHSKPSQEFTKLI